MKVINKIKSGASFLSSKKAYYLPGILLFFILFLISTLLNFSITYMGNTSDKVVDVLLKYYKLDISFQIIKIIFAYLAIGAVISSVIYAAVKKACSMFSARKISIPLIAFIGTLFFAFIVVSKMFIRNPQPYVENFASHSVIFKAYLYFLTDRVNPVIFDIVLIIFSAVVLSLFLLSFKWQKLPGIIQSFFKKNTLLKISAVILIGLLLILYKQNIIFYNTSKNRPNILIISADALRPDHMSLNGYKRNTTPNIDKLAKNSIQFKRTFTALPRTFPAWVSLLTSRYPLTHGIIHMFPRTRDRNIRFDSAVNYLNESGYRTSVISDFGGDIFPRIDIGFKKTIAPDMNIIVLIKQIMIEKQTFLLPFITNKAGLFVFPEMRDMAKLSFPLQVTDETLNEIESARGKPFFITAFYSITHFPFSPPYPYYKKFNDSGYKGQFKYFKDQVLQLDQRKALHEQISTEDKEQVNALYDGCLGLFDNEAGKIINFLKKRNLLENTIVVITSDHGENLYEKDFGMGHGEHLKGNYSLEVPLIIYSSKLKDRGINIERTSSAIDIIPTVFDIAGIPVPSYFDGTSILKKVDAAGNKAGGKVDAYCETGMWFDNNKYSPYFFHHNRIDYPDISGVSEIDFSYKNEIVINQKYENIVNAAKYRAIYSGSYKLIYMPLPHGPVFELYDYIKDPDNTTDLSNARKDILEDMKKRFYGFVKEKSSGNFIVKDGILFPVFRDPVF